MVPRNVTDAKEQLSALLIMVERGEEVVTARAGLPIVRLVPYERPQQPRILGAPRGQIWIGPDFDLPAPELDKLLSGAPLEPVD